MYGHAALLAMTCANDGCDRSPYCTSDTDGRLICVVCAVAEERVKA